MNEKIDITSWKYIWNLSWPVMISNVAIPLVGVTDVAMMAHMPTPQYVGGVSLGMLVFNLIFAGFSFLRMCTTGFTARAYGEKKTTEILFIMIRGLMIALSCGVLIIFCSPLIIVLADMFLIMSTMTKTYMEDYFYLRIWGVPLSLCNIVIIGWLFGMQRMKLAMTLILIINLSNILLNFFFVLGLSMEIKGVALASVFAELIGIIYIIFIFFLKQKSLSLDFHLIDVKNFLKLRNWLPFFNTGGNLILRSFLIWSVEAILLSNASKIGDLQLASAQLILVILGLIAFTLDGFAHASEALVGNIIGRNKKSLLNIIIIRSSILSFLTALFISTLLYLYKFQIINILTSQFFLKQQVADIWIWCILLPLSSFLAFQMDGIFVGASCAKSMRNGMFLSLIIFMLTLYSFNELTIEKLFIASNVFLLSRGLILLILLPIVKKQIKI